MDGDDVESNEVEQAGSFAGGGGAGAAGTKKGHSVKVPRLYKVAAKALQTIEEKGEGLKNVVYSLKHPNVKALTALVSEALKNSQKLDLIIEKSKLKANEPALGNQIFLTKILITELLWGKQRLGGQSKPVQTILGYKEKYENILRKEERKKKSKSKHSNVDQIEDDEETSSPRDFKKPRYVRVNSLKMPLSDAIEYLQNEGWKLLEEFSEDFTVDNIKEDEFYVDDFVENLLVFHTKAAHEFFNHPLYLDGTLILQDKASCLPPLALKPRKGREIIDACAAPGMKTSLLAAITNNESPIIAIEKDVKRFETLKNYVHDMGLTSCKVLNKDFTDLDPESYQETEYILLDPSCSGSGMYSRVELFSSNSVKPTDDNGRLKKLSFYQRKLLLHAMKFPKVKKIVYSTCSLYPEENQDVIATALEESPIKFKVKRTLPNWKNRLTYERNSNQYQYEWLDCCIRSNMEENRTDGFFVAVLERI